MLKRLAIVVLWFGAAMAKEPVKPAEFVMPSYRLEPGQELFYSSTSESRAPYGTRGWVRQWEFYVVGAGDSVDGFPTWRLAAKATDAGFRVGKDGQRQDVPGGVSWATFELGREVRNLREVGNADPSGLFLQLPLDTVSAKRGWLVVTDSSLNEASYVKVENKTLRDSIWLFRMQNSSALDSVYKVHSTAELGFDTRRGLPVRRESRSSSDAGMGESRSTADTKLDSVRTFDTAGLKPLWQDLGRYFAAKAEYDSITDAASERRDTLPDEWNRAESVLVRAKAGASDTSVIALFDDDIAGHRQQVPDAIAEAKAQLALIGRPAPAWTLLDLDGRKHSLKEFRGRVLLLDFWYRACPWCMRAMPTLNQLAQEYPNRAVTVVGMNTDDSLADARFVVEKLGISYLNLRCGDVYKRYGVKGFPTLVVVDPKGRISDIHVGFAPDMKAKLQRSIRRAIGED